MASTSKNITAEFDLAKRSTYLRIDLDKILNNIRILKQKCSEHTEVIAVVKANAYGHGSVAVAKYLESHGLRHFAVASALEGEELRQAGIKANIHVLGSGCKEEISTSYDNNLIPTAASVEFLSAWVEHCKSKSTKNGAVVYAGQVVIKIDTGMSRNGCQPEELQALVEFCRAKHIPIHSMMTHFAQSWDDPVFTKQQYDLFLQTVEPYRSSGIKFHVANSGAIVNGVGTDLDFVRPGISMLGQPPDTSEFGITKTRELGLRPAVCWLAKPSLVKRLLPGRKVGYDQTYTCKVSETIATIPLGYADGYLRNMFDIGQLTTLDGVVCPVVGRVSMDGITIKLPDEVKECREFYVMTDDFNMTNSAVAISKQTNTIPYEVCTNLDRRLPRIYIADTKIVTFNHVDVEDNICM